MWPHLGQMGGWRPDSRGPGKVERLHLGASMRSVECRSSSEGSQGGELQPVRGKLGGEWPGWNRTLAGGTEVRDAPGLSCRAGGLSSAL